MSTNDDVDSLFLALREALGEQAPDAERVRLDENGSATITVRKLAAWAPVSCCVLTDATGVNHCRHPAPPRPPLRRRLRWRLASAWAALRLRVGSWVAGVDLDGDRDDD